jgi:hypothetical protein
MAKHILENPFRRRAEEVANAAVRRLIGRFCINQLSIVFHRNVQHVKDVARIVLTILIE